VALLALGRDDLHAIAQAVAMGDSLGVRQLAASPRFFQVGTDTLVQVLDTNTLPEGPPIRQVRVLAGAHTGESGWVMAEALAP